MLFGFIQTNELHAAAGAIDGDVDSAAERAVDGAVDGAVAGYADRIRRLRKSTIIQHLRTRRIGLVLPGCGAKGAFQAGALKVLHDLGIREFAAISGTSAGSLNGVAVAAAKTDAMVAEWWSMRFGKVINWQYSTIPTALMILIGSTFCFRYRKSALIAYLLALALIMGLMPAGLLKILMLGVTAALLMASTRASGRFSTSIGQYIIDRGLERFSISSSIALRRTISAFLGSGPFDLACPTYLTIAEHRTIEPPARLAGAPLGSQWIPRYVDVQCAGRRSIIETAMKSSSIPLVFRHRKMDGVYVTDGGLADNCPIMPLLADGLCDQLIVIHGNGKAPRYIDPDRTVGNDMATYASLNLARIRQKIRSFTGACPLDDPTVQHCVQAKLDSALHIRPSCRLNRWDSVNFTGARSRELLRHGMMETLAFLEEATAVQPKPQPTSADLDAAVAA